MSAVPTATLERIATHDLAEPDTSDRWQRAVAGWALGYRQPTRDHYLREVRFWSDWLAERGLGPWEAQRGHVEAWQRTLEEEGYAPATINRKLSAVSSLYRWIEDEAPELVDRNPVQRVRRPKVAKESQTPWLSKDEAAAFLAASAGDERDHALACLLLLNGCRVSEVCGANVVDLDELDGYRVLRLRRKGGKVDVQRLAARTVGALRAHIGDRQDGPLVVDDDGERLSRFQAYRIVKRLAKAAGVREISPHGARHTFATHALDVAPLHVVQDAMCHEDPATTRRYTRQRARLDTHPTEAVAASFAQQEDR